MCVEKKCIKTKHSEKKKKNIHIYICGEKKLSHKNQLGLGQLNVSISNQNVCVQSLLSMLIHNLI